MARKLPRASWFRGSAFDPRLHIMPGRCGCALSKLGSVLTRTSMVAFQKWGVGLVESSLMLTPTCGQ
jgi:hypothetical protein